MDKIAETLECKISDAKSILKNLVDDNYLTINKKISFDGSWYKVEETDIGRRFAIATANPPISRKKAELLLTELLNRVQVVNDSAEYAYFVKSVKVFGSYLSDKAILGDLDVAVKLEHRYAGKAGEERRCERISLASKSGRRFSNMIDQLYWPHREVMLQLGTKKKGLSIHDENADEVVGLTMTKTVYEHVPQTE